MSNDGTAAISANAGSVPDCWWQRNSFVASEDTNRSRCSSECWNPSSLPGRKLSCGERHHKVGYLRAVTFNGKSGDPPKKGMPLYLKPRFSANHAEGSRKTKPVASGQTRQR